MPPYAFSCGQSLSPWCLFSPSSWRWCWKCAPPTRWKEEGLKTGKRTSWTDKSSESLDLLPRRKLLLRWNLRFNHHDRKGRKLKLAECEMVRNLCIPEQTQIHLITEVSTFLYISK